jgi:putative Mn2+ efflux pump MntP
VEIVERGEVFMSYFEIIMIGVGLSMDAFAAAVCKGLSLRKLHIKNILIVGLFFGGFQAIMPLAGYFLGQQFEAYITSVDHWIAFLLLSFIGGKMIVDVIKDSGEADKTVYVDKLEINDLFGLSVATSIDALAVGISFAAMKVEILPAALTIGGTTFIISSIGVFIGNKFGAKYKNKATLAGGIILILIGIKIIAESYFPNLI